MFRVKVSFILLLLGLVASVHGRKRISEQFTGTLDVNGEYNSEFVVECYDTNLDWLDARQHCRDRGDGWALATVRSDAVNTALYKLSSMNAYIGGEDVGRNNSWYWVEGRAKNQFFYRGLYVRPGYMQKTPGGVNGATCMLDPCKGPDGVYENFKEKRGSPEPDGDGMQYYLQMNYQIPGKWDDTHNNNSFTRCYVCERSSCVKSLDGSKVRDCLEANTIGVKGYYPNCGCECKEGYSGNKCEIPREYDKATTSNPLTGPYAACNQVVAVPGNPQSATDGHCAPCANGRQSYWPCEPAHVNVLCKCVNGNVVTPATNPPTGPYAACNQVIAVPGNPQSATDEHCAPCANGRQSHWPCEPAHVNVLCKCA